MIHTHHQSQRRVLALAACYSLTCGLLVAGGALLTGCGGGGKSGASRSASATGRGYAQFTIVWPKQDAARSRVIPANTDRIEITFKDANGNDLSVSGAALRNSTAVVNVNTLSNGVQLDLTNAGQTYGNGANVPTSTVVLQIPQGTGIRAVATAYKRGAAATGGTALAAKLQTVSVSDANNSEANALAVTFDLEAALADFRLLSNAADGNTAVTALTLNAGEAKNLYPRGFDSTNAFAVLVPNGMVEATSGGINKVTITPASQTLGLSSPVYVPQATTTVLTSVQSTYVDGKEFPVTVTVKYTPPASADVQTAFTKTVAVSVLPTLVLKTPIAAGVGDGTVLALKQSATADAVTQAKAMFTVTLGGANANMLRVRVLKNGVDAPGLATITDAGNGDFNVTFTAPTVGPNVAGVYTVRVEPTDTASTTNLSATPLVAVEQNVTVAPVTATISPVIGPLALGGNQTVNVILNGVKNPAALPGFALRAFKRASDGNQYDVSEYAGVGGRVLTDLAAGGTPDTFTATFTAPTANFAFDGHAFTAATLTSGVAGVSDAADTRYDLDVVYVPTATSVTLVDDAARVRVIAGVDAALVQNPAGTLTRPCTGTNTFGPVSADYTATVSGLPAGRPVQFSVSPTTGVTLPSGGVATLGADGKATLSGLSFNAPGTYTVTAVPLDNEALGMSATVTIQVVNEP